MQHSSLLKTLYVLLAVLICVQTAMANNNRKAGIGFRGAHWKMSNNPTGVHVAVDPTRSNVDVGSGGGYITFFSRVSDNSWMELAIGAIGDVETHNEYWHGEETDVNAVTPVLLGMRHDLFGYDSPSALIPYVAFGVGPYWFNDIYSRTDYFGFEHETQVKTKSKIGGYAGGGANFMMTSWFGFNFDARYHFINFDVNDVRSGWEYSLGVIFAWGKYKQNHYRRHYRSRRDREDVHIYID